MKNQTPFYVFDVETWGLSAVPDSFALGVIYGENYQYHTTDINELRAELLSEKFKNSIIFAHNAVYDLSTVFGNIISDFDPTAIFNGSTFILAKKNGITFADSYNIFPNKLANIGILMGLPKGSTPTKFTRAAKSKISQKDILYCTNDCRIVFNALKMIFAEAGCVRITLASLAMAYFRRQYLKEPIYYNELVYDFFDSYYGGRVEAFVLGKTNSQKFDINSMYPFSMREATFPDTANLKIDTSCSDLKLNYYLAYYEGFVECFVEHKDTYFGYLPVKRNGKLLFPVGTFKGCWNFNELSFAVEEHIVRPFKIKRVIYGPRKKTIFKEFVNDLYYKRLKTNDHLMKYIYKLIMNSLYGKFAQRKKSITTYFPHLSSAIISRMTPNMQIVPFSIDREDGYLIDEVEKFSYNTIPSISSYITSYARVHLLKQMLKYRHNEIAYCDTDSLAFFNDEIPVEVSENIGDFKREDKIITNIYGNKSYEEKAGKKLSLIMKGIKLGSKRNSEFSFTSKKMVRPKEALRRNLQAGTFITVTKKVKVEYDKRETFPDGTTRPIRLDETIN